MSRCLLQDVPLFRPARSVVLVKTSRCVGRYISSSSPRCPFDVAAAARCLRLRVPAPLPDSIIIYYLSFIISHPKRPVISSQCPFSTSVDLNQGEMMKKWGVSSLFLVLSLSIHHFFLLLPHASLKKRMLHDIILAQSHFDSGLQ